VNEPLAEGAPRTIRRGLVPLLGLGLFLASWWAATDGRHVTGFAASFSLSETIKALRHLVFERELWAHAAGLALSAAIGVPLGCAVGAWPLFASASTPLFQFVRMVSPLSWTPFAIMLFGVGDAPVLFLIVIAGVWPIVLATSSAVASIDRRLTTVGRASEEARSRSRASSRGP
jgi:NitT/TauT family transport system permease protein